MLSPLNTEADRQFTRSRNIAFNTILQNLANEFNTNDPNHYYQFTLEPFNYTFTAAQVSDFDCFHPSAAGQKELSRVSWSLSPFAP
jgi:lysophospholipase L1-like esterase